MLITESPQLPPPTKPLFTPRVAFQHSQPPAPALPAEEVDACGRECRVRVLGEGAGGEGPLAPAECVPSRLAAVQNTLTPARCPGSAAACSQQGREPALQGCSTPAPQEGPPSPYSHRH